MNIKEVLGMKGRKDGMGNEVDKLMAQKAEVEAQLNNPEQAMPEIQPPFPNLSPTQQKDFEEMIPDAKDVVGETKVTHNEPEPSIKEEPQSSIEEEPQNDVNNGIALFKFIVVMEGGIKLHISLPAHPDHLPFVIKEIDMNIETGRMFELGRYRIPGNKVLFIDMLE